MDEVIIFRLGSSEWALSASTVHQVLSSRPVTRLPDPPPLVCGLVAWRARVLPVVTLGERLGCDDPPVDQCTLLVTEVRGEPIALAVDEVMHLAQPLGVKESGARLLDLEQVLNGR